MAFQDTVMARDFHKFAMRAVKAIERKNQLLEEQNKILSELVEKADNVNLSLVDINEGLKYLR